MHSFRTVCFGIVSRYGSASTWEESDRIDLIGLLRSRCCMLALSVELFQLMDEYDFDPVLGPVESARANEIGLTVVDKSGWF